MSVKTQSCGVSISSITVRKVKHQNKVQEINEQLRDLCQAKNVNFTHHSRAGEMDFKVEGPWHTGEYCRAPWLADKKNF